MTFRMKPVLGETHMPLDGVILAEGGNAELRSWKAFGLWVKHHPKSVSQINFAGRRSTKQEGHG